MKVIQLNTNDIVGGASRAANRLHTGLTTIGCDSKMYVLHKHCSQSTIFPFKPPNSIVSRVKRSLRNKQIYNSFAPYKNSRPKGLEIFSDDRTSYGKSIEAQLPKCDIINLHWISGFIDYNDFLPKIPKQLPIVWTLHDMNPFTGGCHYNVDCNQFVKNCGNCPQLGSDKQHDLSRQIFKRKQNAFRSIPNERLHIVTPSKWLANEAKRSSLFERFPISVIPNGLNSEIFKPRDKYSARNVLGIPADAKAVLFVAQSLDNDRKGFSLLIEAFNHLKKNNVFLLSVGNSKSLLATDTQNLHIGNIHNDRFLSIVYSAADIFVIPSLQDNLPNTVLESMACGTPVIGFNTGGIPDMVKPNETGLLVDTGDAVDLASKIEWMLENDAKRCEMGVNSRKMVEAQFRLDIQATKYLELYVEMVKNSK